ncbi:hypothetical protein AX15_001870 [Amanita polypyramis BW_CC]|nr:hypothetical protein AX15_001870 [Amanita polypyramis BW_CC]
MALPFTPLAGRAIAAASRSITTVATTAADSHSVNTSSIPSSTVASTTSSVNSVPFFPDPSTLHPPSSSTHSGQSSGQLAKNVIIYILLAFAVLLSLFLTFKRLRHLQRSDQPLRRFFSVPRFKSSPLSNHPHSETTPGRPHTRPRRRPPSHYVDHDHTDYPDTALYDDDVRYPITTSPHLSSDLRALPLAYYPYGNGRRAPVRRTRAANVDEQGRRLDSRWDPDQQSMDDKEMLPAYDKYGGPPGYVDMEMEMEMDESDRRRRAHGVGDRDQQR